MVNLSQDIHPLTDFKRNTSDFMSQMKKTRRPVVLTVTVKREVLAMIRKVIHRVSDFNGELILFQFFAGNITGHGNLRLDWKPYINTINGLGTPDRRTGCLARAV